MVIQSVFFPTAVAITLFLLPRLPWSVDVGRRIEVWTAAPALAIVILLSLYAVEGSEIWNLTQKWYSLWISAIILGVGGLIARVNFNQSEKPARTTVSKNLLFSPAQPRLQYLFSKCQTMGKFFRVFFAAIAGIATSLLIKPSTRAPVVTPLSFSFVLCILSILLLVSGSLKMALIAASISTTAAACAILASVGGGFSGGASFSMAGISSCIALGLYGMSYHKILMSQQLIGGSWHSHLSCSVWLIAFNTEE